jgi:hypothetical protein
VSGKNVFEPLVTMQLCRLSNNPSFATDAHSAKG